MALAAYRSGGPHPEHIDLQRGGVLPLLIVRMARLLLLHELIVDVVEQPHEKLVAVLMPILLQDLILVLYVGHELLGG